jgi:hypothetical protein
LRGRYDSDNSKTSLNAALYAREEAKVFAVDIDRYSAQQRGGSSSGGHVEMSEETWDEDIDINLKRALRKKTAFAQTAWFQGACILPWCPTGWPLNMEKGTWRR